MSQRHRRSADRTTKPSSPRRARGPSSWPLTTQLATVVIACVVLAWIGACSASSSELDDSGSSSSGSSSNGSGGGLNLDAGQEGGQGPGPAVAYLQGKVYAPEGTIPISGALVYTTQSTPDPIPQKVHCSKCVDIPANVHHTLSEADGSFIVGVADVGDWNLVVQKGTFRRTRTIHVPDAGATVQVDAQSTTLPNHTDEAAGDYIPKIAVSYGIWDDIQDSLAKLGLGQVDSSGNLVPGTEPFDIYEDSGKPPGSQLLTDYDTTLSNYHIVFFPCTDSWPNSYLLDPSVYNNLRNYVQAGGRLYVTDYSYDILRRAFDPEMPLKWEGDFGGFDDADGYPYDANATVNDPGLAEWLAVQGITSFVLEDNWSVIDHVDPYTAPNEDNEQETLTPTVWVSGDVPGTGLRPCTTSFQYGCGRAMFSTYHTEASGVETLMTQELALLYILLEVAVCIGDFPPPR